METFSVADLPSHLEERTRALTPRPLQRSGRHVLGWLHHALRDRENPVLDVAVHAANRSGLPVLVFQEIRPDEPYACARFHRFVLEGARELEQGLARQGLSYALHLPRLPSGGSPLEVLAASAALVITEEYPVAPYREWTERLRALSPAPVWTVDAACVVPMRLTGRAYERAFEYRKATRQLYADRLSAPWPETGCQVGEYDLRRLPFQPVRLGDAGLAELIAECEIDHAIGPVPSARGGSAAGYARWREFLRQGLALYAARRNDPLADGVSRMSPYINYGMVSPFRLAREAASLGGDGPEKFLDELLIWRELAHSFCFHRADHDSIGALPPWAVETLRRHQSDPRPALYDWETLARGRTNDTLWNAAQRSLLRHGELHNNARMTWGKAIVAWTPDAETAWEMMVDLNHRYALDGRNPSSYGGLLWCLGQFDRPFPPEQPIFGAVRTRPTRQHAQRLDPGAYSRHISRPLSAVMPRVAVIGAGISGLICARTLQDHGYPVALYEKARGAGGRMSTRRAGEGLRFDHGAQYFTVRDPRFQRYVEAWKTQGIVQHWNGRITATGPERTGRRGGPTRWAGVGGMNAVCRHLARELDVRLETRVASVRRDGRQWVLCREEGEMLGSFDAVIVAVPAPQAASLLAEAPRLAARAASARMSGCWAVMASFESAVDAGFDGLFVNEGPLAWVARDSSKPGRSPAPDCWVLHAAPEWSQAHLEDPAESVSEALLEAFREAVGERRASVSHLAAHRWRYALPVAPLAERCLFDRELQIGACGDWCSGPRVEGAFLSGMAVAGRVMGLLQPDQPEKTNASLFPE